MRLLLFILLVAIALPGAGPVQSPAPVLRPARAEQAEALAAALEAARRQDWAEARRLGRASGALGADIVGWLALRAGEGAFPDYLDFLRRHPDWPGLPLLRRMGEAGIPEGAPLEALRALFGESPPQTGTGALRLADALARAGQGDAARDVIVRAWRSLSLSAGEERQMLARWGGALVNHHRARQDMLLWRSLAGEAERLNALVGTKWARLARARAALIRGRRKGVDSLVRAVPAELRADPGLAFARFRWRLRMGRTKDAIALMEERSASARALGKPEAWASDRRRLARLLLREGKPGKAYRLAARHFLKDGTDYRDLEWLAGYIALRKLGRPAEALAHFRALGQSARSPISLGRARYWEGRALEAMGQGEAARAAYAAAARHQTSFYGQLASEKIGAPVDPALLGRERYDDFRRSPRARSAIFQAALLLEAAGESRLFDRFLRHMAERLSDAEIGALAQFALNRDEPRAALLLAKYAALRGVVLMRPYFPAPAEARKAAAGAPAPVAAELVLSIIRRESEFAPQAASHAGALGLMQLMPGTGKQVAGKLGLRYSGERLLNDAAYNTRLGSAYLGHLHAQTGPYLPFVIAAYNAGPGRVRQWKRSLGDPRGSVETAVDWIESIPFRETRNYVMRVMEGLAIYRIRLSGKLQPLGLEKALIGR